MMNAAGTETEVRHVNRYLVESMYGGPEEGGWWWDLYHPVASSPAVRIGTPEYDAEVEAARAWEEEEMETKRTLGERGRHSVIGSADPVVLIEEGVATVYPETAPVYE